MDRQDFISQAINYAKHGFLVHPLKGKQPLLKGWTEKATTDEATIENWFRRTTYNVGIVTGEKSGILVVDVDDKGMLSHHPWLSTNTPVVDTAKGCHLYYAWSPALAGLKTTKARILPGIDIRGNGGQVAAPPSIHPDTGNPYTWQEGHSLDDLPLAPVPEALITVIRNADRHSAPQQPVDEWAVPMQDWQAIERAGVGEGERNDTLTRLIGWMLATEAPEDEALQRALAFGERCKPPLDQDEVEQTFESVARLEREKRQDTTAPATPEQPKSKAKRSVRDITIDLTVKTVTKEAMFLGPDNQAYVEIHSNGVKRTIKVQSAEFERLVTSITMSKLQTPPSATAIKDTAALVESIAYQRGDVRSVFVRHGSIDNTIFVDLCRPSGEVVKITSDGWGVVKNPLINFIRPAGMLPLPLPARDGDINQLRGLIHFQSEKAFQLTVGWLVAALAPTKPYPIAVIYGTAGSGKSAATHVLRNLIDPNAGGVTGAPSDERDLIISATNAYVVSLDNLSGLPTQLSDSLCRLSTGGGLRCRKLYTNDEEMIFNTSRPVIVNGIDDLATRGDFASRAFSIELRPFKDGEIVPDAELAAREEKVKPMILHALFNAVSVALREFSNVDTPQFRLAQPLKWCTAAERSDSLPWSEGEIVKAYEEQYTDLNRSYIENDTTASDIVNIMRGRDVWRGTISQLFLEAMETRGGGLPPKGAPANVREFSRALRRAEPALLSQFTVSRGWSAKNRILKIKRVSTPSLADAIEALVVEKDGLFMCEKKDLLELLPDGIAPSNTRALGLLLSKEIEVLAKRGIIVRNTRPRASSRSRMLVFEKINDNN
jgi:hypothetical protein